MDLATEKERAKALALQFKCPFVDLSENRPDPAAIVIIPKELALKHECIAVALEKKSLTVAVAGSMPLSLVQILEFSTGHRIKQVIAERGDILEAIQRDYPEGALVRADRVRGHLQRAASPSSMTRGPAPPTGVQAASGESLSRLLDDEAFKRSGDSTEGSETAPIIEFVNQVVRSAIKSRASDIHIEPMEKGVMIRHRLDGLLKEVTEVPKWVHEGLIARLKVMAKMNIAEKRLPQDGRLRMTAEDGVSVDFRISTLPTIFGEKIVMRVLDHSRGVPALQDIGMSPSALKEMRHFLKHQHGMILVVGPTGSGKSTTLSSALTAVRSEKTNIVTIEDPVEYQLAGVNQTQINEKIDLTFASALRSILRQDPDVILVGEIRDSETARIAMQAAQTGHLVLSTLHTDDAPSCVARLMDLEAEPFVIASALIGVVAQRLVRRLCAHCRRRYHPPADTLRALNIAEGVEAAATFYEAVGCDRCNGTGYSGRIGIYEVMGVTSNLRGLITSGAPETRIREAAIAGGMISLGEDGLLKVKAGITTPDELLRVVTEVREMRTLCPGCGSAVAIDFVACPQCGKHVGIGCPHCCRALQPGWRFCPYCAKSTDAKIKRLRQREARRTLLPDNVAEFKN